MPPPPIKKNGFIVEPTHPEKERFGTRKVIFYREFTENFRQKGQICHKKVIYKSLGPIDLTHPHLGQLSKIYIFGGGVGAFPYVNFSKGVPVSRGRHTLYLS